MADNVTAGTQTGTGPTFATDDIGGVHYPKGKLVFGANDTATDVTSSVGLPVQIVGDGTSVALGAALGSNVQTLIGGSVTTAAPSYTTGQVSPLSLTVAGALRVDVGAANAVAQGASLGSNLQSLAGGSVTTAAPTYTTGQVSPLSLTVGGALRVQDAGQVALGAALGSNLQSLAGGSVTTAAPTYTNGQVSPLSLTTAGALRIEGSVQLAAGSAAIGTVTLGAGSAAVGTVQVAPATSGGASISRTISASGTNATSVKATAGQLLGFYVSNINASPRYLKLYNSSSAPTAGSGTPIATFMIPGNTSGAGANLLSAIGIQFSTGIGFTITTGSADNDTGSVAAGDVIVNLFYA